MTFRTNFQFYPRSENEQKMTKISSQGHHFHTYTQPHPFPSLYNLYPAPPPASRHRWSPHRHHCNHNTPSPSQHHLVTIHHHLPLHLPADTTQTTIAATNPDQHYHLAAITIITIYTITPSPPPPHAATPPVAITTNFIQNKGCFGSWQQTEKGALVLRLTAATTYYGAFGFRPVRVRQVLLIAPLRVRLVMTLQI
nr:hypothetical protein [Tanacetum cinerariifolium]